MRPPDPAYRINGGRAVFYTKISRFIAGVVIVIGLLRLAIAIGFAGGWIEGNSEVLLGSGSTGDIIDQTVLIIFGALVVGVLTDISRSVSGR